MPGLIYFFISMKYLQKEASIIEGLTAACDMCLVCGTIGTVMVYRKLAQDAVSFINEILAFEFKLWIKHSPPSWDRNLFAIGAWNSLSFRFRLPNGKIDWFGILAHMLVASFSVIPPFVPWIAAWLNLDVPYFVFGNIECSLNLPAKILYQGCRTIINFLAAAEASSCFCNIGLYAILGVRGVHNSQSYITSGSLHDSRIAELNQLKIIFTHARDFTAILASLYLAMIYVLLMLCCTLLITTELPWHFFGVVAIVGSIAWVLLITVLALLVSLDLESAKLYRHWVFSCSQVTQIRERRRMTRIVKSTQPIRIPYGTLGSFKQSTRADLLESLISNILNSILTFR